MASVSVSSLVAACGGVVLLLSCGPFPDEAAEPTSAQPAAPTTYAAMDDVPVSGGELRLGEPVELELDVYLELDVEVEAIEEDGETPNTVSAIAFPLQHTDVEVEVEGMVALYTVTQKFSNPFTTPLEAVYVFPLGAGSSVTDYKIAVGDRVIEGVVKEREEARKVYAEAKASGHTAALLEQDKPNVFSQRIANIAPRETVHVRFRYVEMLEYKDNQYELVYPMVVGPRYLPAERAGRRPVAAHRAGGTPTPNATSIPYTTSDRAGQTISFRAHIDAGVPIVSTTSPSHDLTIESTGDTTREVALSDHDTIPNRDLILRYTGAGTNTMVGMLTHRDDGDGYFSLVLQPKLAYRQGDIVAREVVFLIDRSGSMNGAPLGQAKALAAAMVETLGDRDVFNVIAFASGTDTMSSKPVAGTEDGKTAGIEWIKSIHAGGGTEMERATIASLATEPGDNRVRMVYILSDGFIGNDDVILTAAQEYLGHNRIFPVGIGSAPNRYLFDRLADIGRGFPSYLPPADGADALATELVRRSAHPYLTDIEIDWSGLDVTSVTPSRLPDVYAGMPLVVSGRYGEPGSATIELRATGGGSRVEISLPVVLPREADRPAVSYLWANQRIAELLARDYGTISDEVESQVTELGLAFQMVTQFTSFVAVDTQRVVSGGKLKTVVQPVPSPDGVNLEHAVGPTPTPAPAQTASSDSSWSWSGGGGGGGGGDVDPFTLLYLLVMLPAIISLRRLRTRREQE